MADTGFSFDELAADGVSAGAGNDLKAGATPEPGEPNGRRAGGAEIPAGAHRFRVGAGDTGGGLG